MKKITIAVAMLAAAGSAQAAEFKGGWVDARMGWDSLQLEVSGGGISATTSQSGFLYGAAAGYDFPISPSFILGASAGMYGSTAKRCEDWSATEEVCIKAGFDWELLARAGFKVGEPALIYGLIGYANGKATIDYTDTAFPADNFSESGTQGGLRVGVGVEYAFGKSFFGKAEYRYTSYGKEEIDTGISGGFNRNQVLVSGGVRF